MEFYNEPIKNRYLEKIENEGSRNTASYVFIASRGIEKILGKDLYNFTVDEIEEVMKNMAAKTINTARGNYVNIKKYISWCIKNGYREDNLDPLDGYGQEWYAQFIDRTTKIHYSKEELIDLLEQLPNSQDQAFLMLIFEGILGEKFEELRELSYNDIDWNNNKITIRSRDNYVIEVDNVTMRYLKNAYDSTTYSMYNEKTGEYTEKELLPNKYIFKNVKSPRGKEGEPVTPAVFYSRLRNIKTEFELSYLTPNSIRQSGMQWMSVQLYKDKQDKLEYEDFEKIGKRYDFSMLNNNGYTYYNTTLMRQFIKNDIIKELYDIEIEY